MLKRTTRIAASLYLVLIFAVVSLFTIIFYRNDRQRMERISRNTAMFSPVLLWIMGLKYRVVEHGTKLASQDRPLIVANHVSYLDVFILAALRPTLFISSVELSRTPFLGSMSRLGGTVFVERRKNTGLRTEIQKVASILDDGFAVALFPEARTSDGSAMLPFKGALFEAAVKAKARVIPVCIRYESLDGKPLTAENRDRIVYYGGVRFFPHILRLFRHHEIQARVDVFESLGGDKSRKDLARESYGIINKCFTGQMEECRAGARR
ncbi:MAG: lysophospholipid acyltransferase family protein [Desulfonatronovibrionaceae bacterium]